MSWLSKVSGIGINPFGKDKIKIDPMKAAMTALTVGSMGGFGPVAGAINAIPGGAAVLGGVSKVKGALSAIPGVSKLGGLSGGISKVGGFLKDHGDQLLGAGAIGEGYLDKRRSNDLRNEALGIAKQGWGERAPLRSAGVSGMLNEQRPDLSSIYRSPNPYSRVRVA